MEQLKPLTPWQQKMAREIYARATAAGDPDPLGAVAQMMAESKMNPNAVSPAGAVGLAQFIPGTAARFGLKNPRDPYAAIDAAIKYRKVIREYNAKQGLVGEDYVWAGYNAGEGRSALARHRFAETRGYVDRIMAYKPQLAQVLAVPYDGRAMAGALPPDGQASPMLYAGSVGRSEIVRGPRVDFESKFALPKEPKAPDRQQVVPSISDYVDSEWESFIASLTGSPR